MRRLIKKSAVIAIAASMGWILSVVTAQTETTDCTAIASLPYTINAQGIYCLKNHLSSNLATGNAITINTNNVIIDMNGFKIGNLAAGSGTEANGVYAYQRQNITIKNGTIRGFFKGIYLDDDPPYTTSQGHVVENIRADMNSWIGMWIIGRGNIIKNNTVVDTGGNTSTGNNNEKSYGIVTYGPGDLVKDNIVYETKEKTGGLSSGLFIKGDGAVVWNNTVGNADTGPGESTGIYIHDADDALLRNNHITKMNNGIFFHGSTGKYMGNLTSGCGTVFIDGTPIGTND